MERRNNIAIGIAAVVLVILLLVFSRNKRNAAVDTNNPQSHRNLRFSFFNFNEDPKSIALKPYPAAVVSSASDNEQPIGAEQQEQPFIGLTNPSQNHAPPPLPFHIDPNNPSTACDNILLLLPDHFAGHGIGSQLNSYMIAALTATYLDRALVLLAEDEFLGGCPDDMVIHDEATETATQNSGVHFNEKREEFPKSLLRLVDHPEWLSRNCPVPCGDSHTPEDWNKIMKDGSVNFTPAPDVSCDTQGRPTQVMVMNGVKTIQESWRLQSMEWVDRSTEESLVVAYNWALRLGADVNEAGIFASLRDREDIFDYLLALGTREGILRFQPWINRDVETYISQIETKGPGNIQPLLGNGQYAGMHIRRGDKLFRESVNFVRDYWKHHPEEEAKAYIPLRKYLSQFVVDQAPTATATGGGGSSSEACTSMQTLHVYIATDDPTEVHNEIDALPKDENGLSKLTEDNNCLKFEFSFGPHMPGNRYHNLGFKRGLCTGLYHTIVAGIADMTLLARSTTFVGEYNSNWGRLVRMFRLELNDVHKVMDMAERPVIERDTRIAWGNTHAKYIFSGDWKKVPQEEEPIVEHQPSH